ncbi:MAG: DUF1559 domain-containing protein [Lentisphaeria bacterium]|nr:DUF1559 domain-containing protein [Lentisphaeria bacterium]
MKKQKIFSPGKLLPSFTLIELLVVIAIIAILAAMLLPALQRARESGRGISCLNNYKTLGMGFIHYTEEYKGIIPPYWNSIIPLANGKIKGTSVAGNRSWFSARPTRNLIAEYIGAVNDDGPPLGGWYNAQGRLRRSKFACPSREVQADWVTSGNTIGGVAINTYHNWGDSTERERPQPIYRAKKPSRNSLLLEKYAAKGCTGFVVSYTPNPLTTTTRTYCMEFPHNDNASVLLLDGHVEHIKRSRVPDNNIDSTAWQSSFWRVLETGNYHDRW